MKWTIAGSALAVVTVIGGVAAYGPGSGAHDPSPSADTHVNRQSDDRAGDAGQDGPGHAGSAHAHQMVAIAQTHRAGMQKWRSCVQAAAKSGSANPTKGCEKPLPPGWVKHPDQHHGKPAPGQDAKSEKSRD